MRRFYIAASAALLLLAVPSCAPQQSVDTFGTFCATVPVADAAFQIYASTGKVKQSVIDNERKAVAAAQAVCSGPRPTDVPTALAAVSRALAAIAAATADAKSQAAK